MKLNQLVLVSAVAMASVAHAQEGTYLTFGVGHSDNEILDDFETPDGKSVPHSYVGEISLGKEMAPSLAGEMSFVFPFPIQAEDRPEITQIRLNALYFLGDDAVKPYLTAGLGFEEFEMNNTDALDQENYLGSVGLGLQFDLTDSLFGRTEIRLDDMFDGDYEHGVFMLELGYRIGEKAKPVAKPVVQKIVEKKKPVPEPKPVVKPEPKPVPVVVKPKDSDNDGVIDKLDNCPDTFAGASVNDKGCAVFQGTLKGVNFQSGSATLTSESRAILDNAASELVKYPTLKVLVAAYTDSQGSASFNQRLSQKRAESVRNYLISKGVAASALKATGFGESNPIATNETAAGRAENRRVELSVIK